MLGRRLCPRPVIPSSRDSFAGVKSGMLHWREFHFKNVLQGNSVGKSTSPDIKAGAEELHQNGSWSCCELKSAMQWRPDFCLTGGNGIGFIFALLLLMSLRRLAKCFCLWMWNPWLTWCYCDFNGPRSYTETSCCCYSKLSKIVK